jgi:hypothetical protein
LGFFSPCTLLTFFTVSPIYATDFYCSSAEGNGYISTGYTLAKVQSICGAPSQVQQEQTPSVEKQEVQVWTFSPPWLSGAYASQPRTSTLAGPKYNVKNEVPSVSFQVVDNHVVGISGDPTGAAKEWRCPTGAVVKLGNTATQLSSACGQASLIRTSVADVEVQPHIITLWTYQTNPSAKPLVLKFVDGVLQGVQN